MTAIHEEHEMAKFQYKPAMGETMTLHQYFPGELELSPNSSKTEAKWIDGDSLASFTIEGKGLKFVEGILVSGTIEKITFEDVEGADYLVVKGEHNTKNIGQAISQGMLELQNAINDGSDKMIGTSHGDFLEGGSGKDRLFGGDGNDTVWGNAGKDILTGGAGSDVFIFEGAMSWGGPDGHDVVTDFDANGGGANQDYLSVSGEVTDIYKDGKNTVIEVDNELTLVLLNVKRSNISEDDFLT
jgi:Ca2+-binding RTX toxin-like protein